MGNSNQINQLLLKYSDQYIYSYFGSFINSLNQFSVSYRKDLVARQCATIRISDRVIFLRNSLTDLTKIENVKKLEDYILYMFSKTEEDNSQLRGPQAHFSQMMFREFQSVTSLNKSAADLSSVLVTTQPHNVVIPKTMQIVCSSSLQQSYELCGGKMLSSLIGRQVHLTDDNHYNIPKSNMLHNSMPKTQSIGDFVSVAIINNKVVAVQTDAKSTSLDVAMSSNQALEPRVVFTGAISLTEEQKAVRYLAKMAIMGHINVKHIDPKKNNFLDKNTILTKMEQTGEMAEAKDLIGMPFIVSNKYND